VLRVPLVTPTRDGQTARRTVGLALAGLFLLSACAEREVILSGARVDTRTDLSTSATETAQPASQQARNVSLAIGLPPISANADWTHRGGNARHLAPHGSLSAAPVRVWSAAIGAGNARRNRISAAPVVAGGRIFTIDSAGQVVATTTSGARAWALAVDAPFDRGGETFGGGLAYGAGRLFVASGRSGELLAVDASTGGIVWRQRLDSPVSGAPSVDGGTVYVAGRDGAGWAVDAGTGKVEWQTTGTSAATGMLGSAAPAITEESVIFPFATGEVVTVTRAGGLPAWRSAVGGRRLGRAYAGVSDITGDPVVVGDVTYVGKASGRTVALSTATGEVLWNAVEGALGPVLPAGGSVFMVSDEARLVRLDATTGEPIWKVDMPYFENDGRTQRRKSIVAHYGPVLAGGRLVVAGGDGLVRFFSPIDGRLTGTADLPGGAAAQPALAGGVLYVVSANGQLHAFR